MQQIAYEGTPIGVQASWGLCLDKAAFRALRQVDRIRAYLLTAWPGTRSRVCLGRVTGIPDKDVSAHMRQDLNAGRIVRVARGVYRAAVKEAV